MLIRTVLASLIFSLFFQSQAEAAKAFFRMSPPIKSDTFVFESKPLENGKTRIIFKRNLKEANEPANQNLHLVRGATLQVRGESESVVTVSVEPREDKDGWLVYRFEIKSDYLPYSRFTFCEIEDYKNGTGYIGGGTIYECSLVKSDTEEEKLKKLIESIKAPEIDAKQIEKLLESVPAPEKIRVR